MSERRNESEEPAFLHEGIAWQTMPLSWWETDANGVRWERQVDVTAAGVLEALRREWRESTDPLVVLTQGRLSTAQYQAGMEQQADRIHPPASPQGDTHSTEEG